MDTSTSLNLASIDFSDARRNVYPRPQWLFSVVSRVQAVAIFCLEPDFDVYTVMAQLVARIEPPRGAVERLLAAYLLQDAARALVGARVAANAITPAEMVVNLSDISHLVWRVNWDLLSSSLEIRARSPKQNLAERVRTYIDEHSTDTIPLHQIARRAGASVRTITTVFRNEYGISLHTYLTRRRLAHALALLSSPEIKISAVASDVGMGSKATLYRQLFRLTGRRPGEFRRFPDLASTWRKRLAEVGVRST